MATAASLPPPSTVQWMVSPRVLNNFLPSAISRVRRSVGGREEGRGQRKKKELEVNAGGRNVRQMQRRVMKRIVAKGEKKKG